MRVYLTVHFEAVFLARESLMTENERYKTWASKEAKVCLNEKPWSMKFESRQDQEPE